MSKPKLLDRVHAVARVRRPSLGTESAYSDWVRRFILFHKKRPPEEMGAGEIREFLSHLAVEGGVAASTQNVALCALLFLYRGVLGVELPYVDGIQRAKRPARVPVVFTRAEAAGQRPRLRVRGDTRARREGENDPRTVLPRPLAESLRQQLDRVKLLHEQDLRDGSGEVYLPYALGRKYPKAAREWAAVRLPLDETLRRPALRRDAPLPRIRRQRAAGREDMDWSNEQPVAEDYSVTL